MARLLWNPTFKAIFSGHVGGLLPHVAAEAVVEACLIFSKTRHARWIGFKETLGLQSIKHVLTLSLLDFLLSFFGILLFSLPESSEWCLVCSCSNESMSESIQLLTPHLNTSSTHPLNPWFAASETRILRDVASAVEFVHQNNYILKDSVPGWCLVALEAVSGIGKLTSSLHMYAWISACATQRIPGRQAHQLNHLHTTFYS